MQGNFLQGIVIKLPMSRSKYTRFYLSHHAATSSFQAATRAACGKNEIDKCIERANRLLPIRETGSVI